jgi:uncharacterized protein
MARLFCNDSDIAPVEVADTPAKRMTGLLKRDGIDGAMLLPRTSSVHTFRMRFDIDVAFCDRNSRVIEVITMKRNRLGRPRFRARYVVESNAGAMTGWGVEKGAKLDVQT